LTQSRERDGDPSRHSDRKEQSLHDIPLDAWRDALKGSFTGTEADGSHHRQFANVPAKGRFAEAFGTSV